MFQYTEIEIFVCFSCSVLLSLPNAVFNVGAHTHVLLPNAYNISECVGMCVRACLCLFACWQTKTYFFKAWIQTFTHVNLNYYNRTHTHRVDLDEIIGCVKWCSATQAIEQKLWTQENRVWWLLHFQFSLQSDNITVTL